LTNQLSLYIKFDKFVSSDWLKEWLKRMTYEMF
jgi:hypothetical protein